VGPKARHKKNVAGLQQHFERRGLQTTAMSAVTHEEERECWAAALESDGKRDVSGERKFANLQRLMMGDNLITSV
jgi:hypothetical protein